MPPRLEALTAGLTAAQLQTAPNEDEWSANDVLAHLRACADVWGGCIAAMIAENMPTLRAVNPRTWIKQTDYRDQEFLPSLRAFAVQRAELLSVLEPLPPEGWSRAAAVTGAEGARADGTVLRALAGWSRTAARQADRTHRHYDPRGALTTPGLELSIFRFARRLFQSTAV